MEEQESDKSSNTGSKKPDDMMAQAQVEKRLKDVTEAQKQVHISLKGGPVPSKIKWLHEYVLSGSYGAYFI